MKTRKRTRYNDPFKRLKWVPLFWCLVLLTAGYMATDKINESADNYYATLQTSAGH